MGRNQRRRLQKICIFLGHRWLNWPVSKGIEPSIPHLFLDIDGSTQDSEPSTLTKEYTYLMIFTSVCLWFVGFIGFRKQQT